MDRFEIAKGETPKPEPEKKVEKKKPLRRVVINYEEGDKVRQVIVNSDESTEIPSIRRRLIGGTGIQGQTGLVGPMGCPDAHSRTHVGGMQESRTNNANEAFDSLLDHLIDKDV